jgi:hypothetical protein
MSGVEKIIATFRVTVSPILSNVEDKQTSESTDLESPQSIPFDIHTSTVEKSRPTTITLRSEWAMVLAHPLFQVEFQCYICKCSLPYSCLHSSLMFSKGTRWRHNNPWT